MEAAKAAREEAQLESASTRGLLGDVASFNEFKQRDEATIALARRIGDRLRTAVYRRACASMIVSVAAPRPLFRTLRLLPVPWYLVTIVPSDEGWVPVDDDDSNEGLIRRDLLAGEPGFANFVSLYRRNRAAPDSLPELHASLKEVHRPFDAVVLGMGSDGHMASLFPDSPDLHLGLYSDAECFVQAPRRSRQPHVSLTVRSLLDAREVNLLFFGEHKRAVYEDCLRPGPVEQYPVRALVRQNRVPINVYWAP
jgi:6-phosphogluconolactonase